MINVPILDNINCTLKSSCSHVYLQHQQACSSQLPRRGTAPGPGSVGRPGVYRDPDKRGVEPVRCLLERQLGHGGDPRHPRNKLGARWHIEAFA